MADHISAKNFFSRIFNSQQVTTKEPTALLPFADGKAMDCRHLFGAFAVSNLKTVFRGSLYGKG